MTLSVSKESMTGAIDDLQASLADMKSNWEDDTLPDIEAAMSRIDELEVDSEALETQNKELHDKIEELENEIEELQ